LLGFAQTALATTLGAQPNLAAASDSAFARAIASFQRDSVRSRAELAFALTNWGTILGRRGLYARAAELKREGLRNLQSVYGPQHYLSAVFQQRLTEELLQLDRLDEARAVIDSAIAVQESLSPTNFRETGSALRVRGAIQTRSGQLHAAEQTLKRAHSLLDSMGETRTVPEIGILTEFSRLYEATGRMSMARSELERALAIARKELGPGHVVTLASIGRLADFSSRTGDPDRAVLLRADSVAAAAPGDDR
jgi:tetratricopeptide (TPR) repeat protein